jgi:hypothetical protein
MLSGENFSYLLDLSSLIIYFPMHHLKLFTLKTAQSNMTNHFFVLESEKITHLNAQ